MGKLDSASLVPPSTTLSAPVSGGADSPSVDGERLNSNSSGGASASPTKEPSSNPNRRTPVRDRAGKEKASSPKGSDGVSDLSQLPRAFVPSTEDGGAGNILQTIGQRFTEARKEQKAEAWRQLQSDLMNNAHWLCPVIIPLKDLIAAAREIEEFVKGSTGQVGRSNEELMAEFLSGGGNLAEGVPNPIPEEELSVPFKVEQALDNGSIISKVPETI